MHRMRLRKRCFQTFVERKKSAVGAAFITPALPLRPAWILPEHGRDECCPYRRSRVVPCKKMMPTRHSPFACVFTIGRATLLVVRVLAALGCEINMPM